MRAVAGSWEQTPSVSTAAATRPPPAGAVAALVARAAAATAAARGCCPLACTSIGEHRNGLLRQIMSSSAPCLWAKWQAGVWTRLIMHVAVGITLHKLTNVPKWPLNMQLMSILVSTT
jgi:hypothetical protein